MTFDVKVNIKGGLYISLSAPNKEIVEKRLNRIIHAIAEDFNDEQGFDSPLYLELEIDNVDFDPNKLEE